LPSAAGGTPARQPPGRRRYLTSTGHSHPLHPCPASHTLQRRHLAGCPGGIQPSAAGGTPAGLPPGRRRYLTSTGHSHPLHHCPASHTLQRRHPAGCPEGMFALGGGRDARRTAAGTAALPYVNRALPSVAALPGIAHSPAPASCRLSRGHPASGCGRDARRTAAGTAALPYINHTASTSTITCVRGIFCCAAYASIVRSNVFSFSRLADFSTK
jgi:hypothetical protein